MVVMMDIVCCMYQHCTALYYVDNKYIYITTKAVPKTKSEIAKSDNFISYTTTQTMA